VDYAAGGPLEHVDIDLKSLTQSLDDAAEAEAEKPKPVRIILNIWLSRGENIISQEEVIVVKPAIVSVAFYFISNHALYELRLIYRSTAKPNGTGSRVVSA
jgi:hypothetical protein